VNHAPRAHGEIVAVVRARDEAGTVADVVAGLPRSVGGHPVPPDRVVLIGTRALSPEAEGRRLGASSLSVARWRDGRPTAEVDALLDDLQKRASDVYVHLDVDALDPHAGPGVADPPVPGGLTADQLVHTLEAIITRFTVAGATVATFTPSHDDGRTLRAALRAVERLTCARAPRRPRSTSGRSADRP
jgi:arginase